MPSTRMPAGQGCFRLINVRHAGKLPHASETCLNSDATRHQGGNGPEAAGLRPGPGTARQSVLVMILHAPRNFLSVETGSAEVEKARVQWL